jgi:hypothetical protein
LYTQLWQTSTTAKLPIPPSLTGRLLGTATACTSLPESVSQTQLQRYSPSSPISSRGLCPGDSPKLGGTWVGVFAYKKQFQWGGFRIVATKLVFHASELRLLFGPVPAPGVELEFANTMLDFYINFVNDLNPGRMYFQLFCFWGRVVLQFTLS